MDPMPSNARRGPNTKPSNALTEPEEREVIALMNAPEHSSMSPDTLVPYLATPGIYADDNGAFLTTSGGQLLRAKDGDLRRLVILGFAPRGARVVVRDNGHVRSKQPSRMGPLWKSSKPVPVVRTLVRMARGLAHRS